MKNVFLCKKSRGKSNLLMFKILTLIVISLMSLISCSTYIPLTRDLVINKKLTSEDLELIQFYSYGYEIKFKGADIKKTSEGIKSGEIYKGEQIERNYVIIPERTSGGVKKVNVNDDGFPEVIYVLYDKEFPLFKYELVIDETEEKNETFSGSTTRSNTLNGYYCLINEEIIINNAIFKNKKGHNSKIYVNKDELQKLIEHKKFAKGIKVDGTKLEKKEEILDD